MSKFEIPVFILTAVVLIFIQITLVPIISVNRYIPDLLLIMVVFLSLRKGQFFGTVSGGVIGLIYDLASGNLLGSGMFAKTLSGFIAGYFYNETTSSTVLRSYRFLLIVILAALINSSVYHIVAGYEISYGFVSLLLSSIIPDTVYTGFMALPVIFYLNFRGESIG